MLLVSLIEHFFVLSKEAPCGMKRAASIFFSRLNDGRTGTEEAFVSELGLCRYFLNALHPL